MKELVIKKLFEQKNIKPLFGQNRPKKGGSYPRPATKRKFTPNWQKFRVGSRVYRVPVKLFRTYLVKLRKGEL